MAVEKRCWLIKNCEPKKRIHCPAYKHKKNCWQLNREEGLAQCATDLKACAEEKCPVFLDNAAVITKVWLKNHRLNPTG